MPDEGSDGWQTWIDMETVRDVPSPWLLVGVVWTVLIAALSVAFLLMA